MENQQLKSLQEYFYSHPLHYIPWCQRSGQLPPPLFFFPSAKHYLVTAGYADFHRYKWLRLQTRRSNCCRINLHHIQTSKPPALFHTPWISQSLKLGYQTCNSLWVFLILSIVYAEISPKFTSQNCTVPLF